MPESPGLTYGSYLHVDALLKLQIVQTQPEQHDEMLFIVIHQVYELWFKQLLHELDGAIQDLRADALMRAAKKFRRVDAIQRLLEQQVDILETMTPQEFNAFRDHLNPASGFQSAQFRELEYLCGLRRNTALSHLRPTPEEYVRLQERLAAPTLYDELQVVLARRGFATATTDELVATFKTIYDNSEANYALYLLLEDLIEFDERMLLWRGRHVRMVERMIGMKMGTGGSLGARYLHTTLDKRFFPELWEVRSHLGSDAVV